MPYHYSHNHRAGHVSSINSANRQSICNDMLHDKAQSDEKAPGRMVWLQGNLLAEK